MTGNISPSNTATRNRLTGATFRQRWQQLDWDDITLRINSKTRHDVEHALNSEHLTLDDFMALLSPQRSLTLNLWLNGHNN